MEGLAAFFVESTFLGLWIFGWGRLSKGVHLACARAVAGSTALWAWFILAANSWMQHPVGYKIENGRPQLTIIAKPGRYELVCHLPGHYAAGQHIPFAVE
jgi:cytochrome d ubiquinol oxidase subunit I